MAVFLDRLEQRGWLSYDVGDEVPLVRAHRRGRYVRWQADDADLSAHAELWFSEHCSLAPRAGRLVAVVPSSGFEVEIFDIDAVLPLLTGAGNHSLAPGIAQTCILLLLGTGVLTSPSASTESSGAMPHPLTFWEPADIAFHTSSREGFVRRPFGGTYRFTSPQPRSAEEGASKGPIVALETPSEVGTFTGHLFQVLEQRRSVRRNGRRPMTVAQLGEFLHRVAHTLETRETEYGRIELRPYPSGGAIHELCLHLIVNRVGGLAPGVYRYRAGDHALERSAASPEAAAPLLQASAAATMREEPPDVLIVITAQVPRLAWKYEGIAYALILKHVGVLMQTMYLVATAMSLAPCAVGGGDAALFAEVTSIDVFEEPSVGEFILGSMPDEPATEVSP
jgi:SagB-type dehydrogenase family enzyme